MLYSLDQTTLAFSVISLLVLSLVTLEFCRKDALSGKIDADSFWMAGKTKAFSFASVVGSLASVTFFFGGGITYGLTFGWPYVLVTAAVFVTSIAAIRYILRDLPQDDRPITGNPLVNRLRTLTTDKDRQRIIRIYVLIYAALLIEELAASRLALSAMIPDNHALVVLFLSVMVVVMFVYVYLGGFRAVLNSDVVQLSVLAPFVGALAFLVLKERRSLPPLKEVLDTSQLELAGLVFIYITGVAWFVSGYDFFARLNFLAKESLPKERREFVGVALSVAFLLLLMAEMYGVSLRTDWGGVGSTVEFSRRLSSHFLEQSIPFAPGLFVVALICMIFTTIDTLLLTLFQLGHEGRLRLLQRKRLAPIFSGCVIISSFLDLDMVSVTAVFLLGLMLVPATGLLVSFLRPRSSLVFLDWSVLFSFVLFAMTAKVFIWDYGSHFLIPGLVALTLPLAYLGIGLAARMRREAAC